MKKLYKLFNFEVTFTLRAVLLVCFALIAGQNLLLCISNRNYPPGRYIPFEKLIDISGTAIVFIICLVLILSVCVYSVLSNYSGSKSIYTLMTIPGSRGSIFVSKLLSGLTGMLLLLASQLISIFLGYLLFSTTFAVTETSGLIRFEEPVNGLFLAFVRSGFLRILYPLGVGSFICTAFMYLAVVTGVLYSVYCFLSKKFLYITAPAIQVILMVFILAGRLRAENPGGGGRLYIYSLILSVFTVYYIRQCLIWTKRSTILD
ncbi:hypothetical protein CLHUN_19730 [Ruminiclostridium hungatei]|uniref:ABC-2 family transporter protein n=1 Tax=Ruminiclostridium hungatei TaxID=48256 RepID=A0A1V4SK34_RUMHU|nr:hypothetical protein [Ruminiclostridium hungatei]OPX44174.1 hypothetical protein CLHUN_19730 [Ruminiclostridium hungatei]